MNILAVIWDFGGVLYRTVDYSSRDRLALRLGRSRQSLEELVFGDESGRNTQLGSISESDHWEYIRRILNLSSTEMVDFRKDFSSGDRLDNQLIGYIRSLRPNYKTGLLSNNFPSLRHMMTEDLKIDDAFDAIVISAEVGIMKPEKQMYQLVLNDLNLNPEYCVFIDDFIDNIEGARKSGMHAIQYLNTDQIISDLDRMIQKTPGQG